MNILDSESPIRERKAGETIQIVKETWLRAVFSLFLLTLVYVAYTREFMFAAFVFLIFTILGIYMTIRKVYSIVDRFRSRRMSIE